MKKINNIILYSNDCPRCRVLKKKLDEKGVIYSENKSVEEMLSLGITEVPVLNVNGTMMDFKEAISWVQ